MAGSGTIAEQVAKPGGGPARRRLHARPQTPGGVQQNLVDTLLAHSQVGNVEQFVTGFVLLARSLGIDARIATGYKVEARVGNRQIKTSDAYTWAEVRAATAGPRSTSSRTSETDTPQQSRHRPVSRRLLRRSSRPTPRRSIRPTPNDTSDAPLPPAEASGWSEVQVWALRGGLFTGLLLWPLIVFAAVVTGRSCAAARA